LDVKVINRENEIKISGFESKVDQALEIIRKLLVIIGQGDTITTQNVNYLIQVSQENLGEADELPLDLVCLTARGKPIKSKTYGQKKYIEAIRKDTIVFCIGPAGTGKTFLAVAMAVKAVKSCGMEDFQIDIGQVDFFKGIMEESGLTEEEVEEVRELIDRKDFDGVEQVMTRHNVIPELKSLIQNLPRLFGSKDILSGISQKNIGKKAADALANLKAVLEMKFLLK
jgi:SpoVK/Ycf46/Vps4 family AAA+-type ATPase